MAEPVQFGELHPGTHRNRGPLTTLAAFRHKVFVELDIIHLPCAYLQRVRREGATGEVMARVFHDDAHIVLSSEGDGCSDVLRGARGD